MSEVRADAEKIVEIVDAKQTRWRVVEGAAPLLFAGNEFVPAPAVISRSPLRETASRRIERIGLAGGTVVVKTYVTTDPAQAIVQRFFGPVPAAVEFDRGLELFRLGFPVAEPLAAGTRFRGLGVAESTLVTRFADGGVDLVELARARSLDRAGRNGVIEALADLVRGLHEVGASHDDLHLGNLLVVDAATAPRLVLIDLRRVTFGTVLEDGARVESLASLGRASYGVVSRTERLRFLRRYLRGGTARTLGPRAKEIEQRIGMLVRAHAERRARSALRGDARFERLESGGVQWVVRRLAKGPDLARLLGDPEIAFDGPGACVLKSGRSSTVALFSPFVVKRFNLKKLRNVLLDRLRPSRARAALARAIVLDALRIPTAPVVAAGEVRRSGLVTRGYLVMAEIAGATSLVERLRAGGDGPTLVRAAGRLIAKLHARGLVHRDLKATNFLVDPGGTVSLIDLDGMALRRVVPDDRAARDVERLARDLGRENGLREGLPSALVEGYLEVRPDVDAARILRAAGVAAPEGSAR